MKRRTKWVISIGLVLGVGAGIGLSSQRPHPCERAEGKLLLAMRADAWERVVKRADVLASCRPADTYAHFSRALALARLNRPEDSLTSLRIALALGYDEPAWQTDAEAFAPYREDRRFIALADEMKKHRRERLETIYRPGPTLQGVRVLEGRPEDGLWWRLYLPPRPSETRLPLLVWMHPSGGSENHRVEPLAPEFLEAGWALLVPTAKDFDHWSGPATGRLFEHTLAEAGAHPEVDPERPIVFGYSAGGQQALLSWQRGDFEFSGLVLMAAYPLDSQALAEGKWVVPDPPEGEGARLPIFALIGARDTGSGWWARVATHWKDRPGSLEIHRTPALGHTWVLDTERKQALLRWLKHRARERTPALPGPRALPDLMPEKTAAVTTP